MFPLQEADSLLLLLLLLLLQPGMGFGLLYKVIPLLSINQLLPVLHLEHLYIFEDSMNPSILGSFCWPFLTQ
jgi:hypothetical protein